MKRRWTKDSSRIHYLFLTGLYLLFFLLLFQPWQGVGSDEIFYYSYLSSFFFDGDIDVINDIYLSNTPLPLMRFFLYPHSIGQKGLVINLWAIGSAILWTPFFVPVRLFGCGLNLFLPSSPLWVNDRFSSLYLLSISFGTLCYGFLTLILLYAICRFQYRAKVSLLTALTVIFASPLLAYIFNAPALSHTPSAFSSALLLYLCFRHRHFQSFKSYLLIASALALSTLVRWQNILFMLIPVAFWLKYISRHSPRRFPQKELISLLLSAFTFIALISIQLFYWWAQSGSFLSIPHSKEFMKWTSPSIYNLLFSGWSGLYYWHPVLFLASLGLIIYLGKNRDKILPLTLILCFSLIIYVNSAVYDWHSYGGFGARRFCSATPIFALGLAAFYNLFRRRLATIPTMITIIAIVFNIFLFSAVSRRILDVFFFDELFLLRKDFIALLPQWILSIPLNSFIFLDFFLIRDYFSATLLLFIGAFLLTALLCLILGGYLSFVEKRASLLILPFVISFLLLDIMLLLRSHIDTQGLRFRSLHYEEQPWEKKKELIQQLQKAEYHNPGVYFYAVYELGLRDSLEECLRAVYEISPKVWEKWLKALPQEQTARELDIFRDIFRDPFTLTWHGAFYFNKINEYRRAEEIEKEERMLKYSLRYHPFLPFSIKRLMEIYRLQGKEEEAKRLGFRLRRYLEAKINKSLRREKDIQPYWRETFMKIFFLSYAKELGAFYEENNEPLRAISVYSEIERIEPKDSFTRQRRLNILEKLTATETDKKILLQQLDNLVPP